MTGMVADLTVDDKAMRKAAGAGYSTATDLADWLVRVLGLPFREAHEVTGRIVAAAESKGVALRKAAACRDAGGGAGNHRGGLYRAGSQAIGESRTSHGGTAPKNVRREARKWLKRLTREENRGGTG
jgi:argininosuccinate lyase